MRRIRISIEPPTGGPIVEVIEVADGATDEDISDEAATVFGNYCSYGWSELAEGEEADD